MAGPGYATRSGKAPNTFEDVVSKTNAIVSTSSSGYSEMTVRITISRDLYDLLNNPDRTISHGARTSLGRLLRDSFPHYDVGVFQFDGPNCTLEFTMRKRTIRSTPMRRVQ